MGPVAECLTTGSPACFLAEQGGPTGCLRAYAAGEPVELRYPQAVRPWQHVLEPLSGYLLLARSQGFEGGWNFGPRGGEGHAEVGRVALVGAAQEQGLSYV